MSIRRLSTVTSESSSSRRTVATGFERDSELDEPNGGGSDVDDYGSVSLLAPSPAKTPTQSRKNRGGASTGEG